MASDRQERDLDFAGHRAHGQAHAANPDDAVRRDDMDAAIAAAISTAVVTTSTPPVPITKAAAVLGVDPGAAHGDHKHDVSTDVPVDIGTGNAESATTALARAGHVHNLPFTPVQVALAAATGDVSFNTHKLTNLLTATNPADGVPLAQAQALDTAAIVVSEGFATAADAALLASIRQPKRGEYWVYCLDYDGTGNDTTGAPGIATTMAAALAAATATPFKTYERVSQLRPSNGGGATLVELAKPRAAAAPYRNMANSADQDGSWLSGLSNWHFLSRGSLDFANDTNDKIRAGFLTLAGTNGAGYKVTASSNANGSTTLTCVLAGGGAPGFAAESGGFSALTGLRIRGLATNPTVALQNFCVGIQKNTGTTIGTMATLPATPLPPTDPSGGDVFVIETPGVTVGNLTHFAGYNRTFCLVGFNATATSALNHQTPTSRITGCNLTTASFSDGEIYAALTSYVDEADANITVGCGFKCSTGVSFNSTKAVTVFASSWLGATQMSVGTTVLSSSIGGGCVSVQGLRNNATYGPSVTTIGNLGSGTIAAFRVTGATVGATAGIHCGGIGARIFGVDFGHCTTGCVALDSANAGAGKYYLDGLTSVDGGNAGGASPNESFVVRVTGIKQEDGLTVFVGTVAANTAVADRDIVSDGGVRGRFSDLISQNLAIRGIHIYGPAPLPGDAFNDSVRGPTTLIETHNTSFYGGGPFPPFRVVNFIGYPNGPGTAPVGLLAIADTIANCKAVAGVNLNYVWVAGDLWSCAQAGPVKIEFVAGQLGALTGGEMAYLSELGGADSGKARVGPPPTGVVVPLGPIQSHSDNALTINTALVNLIGFGPAFVARDGHAAESIIANPTGAVGSAADVGVSVDSVVGRTTGHVVGNISMTAAGRAMAGAASATAQTALLDLATGSAKGLAPARTGPAGSYFDVTGAFTVPPGGGGTITALTGDVAASGTGSVAATIQAGAVTNAKRANMAASTISGNATGAPAAPTDLTAAAVKTLLAISFADVSGQLTAAQHPALTGDVTTPSGSLATTIAANAVDNTKAADMATARIKGRATAGTGDPEDLTAAAVKTILALSFADVGSQLLAAQFPALTGDVTTPGGSFAATLANLPQAVLLARAAALTAPLAVNGQQVTNAANPTSPQALATKAYVDAQFSGGVPLTDGNKGDITVSLGGTAWLIEADVVSFVEMANIPTDTLIGRDTAGAGDPESIGVTGGIEFDGAGHIRRSALTGDVVASAGSAATAISNNAVTNAQLADVPTGTLKGRAAGGAGDPSDLTFAAVKSALAIVFADITGTLQASQFPSLTGDITTVGGSLATTLSATGVAAGTYGDGSHVAQITVDAKGRITAASAPSISITAGAVAGLAAIATTGSATDLTTGTVAAARLAASGVTPGTYGDATHIPVVSVDAAGRVTNVVSTAISAEAPLTFLSGVTRSSNTIRNDLITGKAGGQAIVGGTIDFDNLVIQSNNATLKGYIQLDSPIGIQSAPSGRYFFYATGNATYDRAVFVVGGGPTLGSQVGLYAQLEMASGATFVTPSSTFTDLAHVHIGVPTWVDPSGASSVSGTVATVLIEGAPSLTNFDALSNNRKYALHVKAGNVLINDLLTVGTQLNVPDIHGTSATFGGSGSVRFDGPVGFYATSPIAKPTVAGARGGNAAVQSLCTALASLGLITNSTT